MRLCGGYPGAVVSADYEHRGEWFDLESFAMSAECVAHHVDSQEMMSDRFRCQQPLPADALTPSSVVASALLTVTHYAPVSGGRLDLGRSS